MGLVPFTVQYSIHYTWTKVDWLNCRDGLPIEFRYYDYRNIGLATLDFR